MNRIYVQGYDRLEAVRLQGVFCYTFFKALGEKEGRR